MVVKKKIAKLFGQKRSALYKNVITMMTTSAIAQLIPILTTPILSRLYSPSDFGVYALFLSLVTLFSVFFSGRYEGAFVLSRDDELAYKLLAGVLGLSILLFLLSYCLSLFFSTYILWPSNVVGSFLWPHVILFSALLLAFVQIFTSWNNRSRLYKKMGVARITQAVGTSSYQLFAYSFHGGYVGLVIGFFLGNLFSLGVLCNGLSLRKAFNNKQQSLKQLQLHKDFPAFALPSIILDIVGQQIPIFFLSHFFSNTLLGLYSLALRMLMAPVSFMGQALGQVFYEDFTKKLDSPAEALQLIIKVWKTLFYLASPPLIVIYFFGENIFSGVFGAQWREAGKIASALAPMILMVFISSPTSMSSYSLGFQRLMFFLNLIAIIYRLLAFYLAYKFNNIYYGVHFLVLCEILMLLFYNFKVFQKLNSLVKHSKQ